MSVGTPTSTGGPPNLKKEIIKNVVCNVFRTFLGLFEILDHAHGSRRPFSFTFLLEKEYRMGMRNCESNKNQGWLDSVYNYCSTVSDKTLSDECLDTMISNLNISGESLVTYMHDTIFYNINMFCFQGNHGHVV